MTWSHCNGCPGLPVRSLSWMMATPHRQQQRPATELGGEPLLLLLLWKGAVPPVLSFHGPDTHSQLHPSRDVERLLPGQMHGPGIITKRLLVNPWCSP